MSVQSTLARIVYTISGAGPYTIPYYFLSNSDLVVLRSPAGGADPVTLTLTTDYTVTGAGLEAGGALTLVAPVNGDKLTIINEPPINQLSSFPETGKLPAKSIENALDKLTMVMKRVYDLASRGLRLNDGDSATSFVFPVSVPGKLIGWGSDGKLTNTSPTAIGPNSIGTAEIIDGAVTVAKIADGELKSLADLTAQQVTDLKTLNAFVGGLLNEADGAAFRTAIGAKEGTVTSVTGTSPVAVATGTTTPVISMPAASAGVAGHMTAAYASKLDGIQAGANYFVGVPLDTGASGLGMFKQTATVGALGGGADCAAGATIAGSSLSPAVPGTWRNVGTYTIYDTNPGPMQRIS